MVHRRAGIVCLVALGPLCLSTACAGKQSSPGWSMTTSASITSDVFPWASMEMKFDVTKRRVRLSSELASLPATSGMYMILDDSTGTMITVMPSARMVMIDDLRARTAPLPRPFRIEMKGEPILEVEDRGAGGTVLGMATRHYHVHKEYPVLITSGATSCERKSISNEDVWTTTDIDVSPTLEEAMTSLTARNAADVDMTKLRVAEREKVKGFRLKTLGMTKLRAANGKESFTEARIEVTALTKGSIPSSRFAIPAGYRTTDTRNVRPTLDSVALARARAATAGAYAATIKPLCGS